MRGTTQYCFDSLGVKEEGRYPLGLFYCQNGKSEGQVFTLTKGGEFRREDTCATVQDGTVSLTECYSNKDQKWQLRENGKAHSIVHEQSGLCMDITGVESGKQVKANKCDQKVDGQKFTFGKMCDA